MAIEIPDGRGGYEPLNGNQTGALLIAYMAMAQFGEKEGAVSRAKDGSAPGAAEGGPSDKPGAGHAAAAAVNGPAMIKSIVTGDFGRAICEDYGIRVYEALTGFKNICGVIPRLEKEGYSYFFGYEESIGCAPGEAVRDKDGICAGMLVMEMAAWCKKRGRTIRDLLESLYRRYGYFVEDSVSVVLKGQEGAARIGRIMDSLRGAPPRAFDGLRVAKVTDYIDGYEDIPASNVLKFTMEDGSWFAMRPSGTEPKIKFYYYAVSAQREEAADRVRRMRTAMDRIIGQVE